MTLNPDLPQSEQRHIHLDPQSQRSEMSDDHTETKEERKARKAAKKQASRDPSRLAKELVWLTVLRPLEIRRPSRRRPR